MTRTATGVLFLCEYNSCRSQIAEGLARQIAPPGVNIYSAGLYRSRVNATAIEVMREVGVNISGQTSKTVTEVPLQEIGLVVTLCDPAVGACPTLPGMRQLHWLYPDPIRASGGPDVVRQAARAVRDDLAARLKTLWPSAHTDETKSF